MTALMLLENSNVDTSQRVTKRAAAFLSSDIADHSIYMKNANLSTL